MSSAMDTHESEPITHTILASFIMPRAILEDLKVGDNFNWLVTENPSIENLEKTILKLMNKKAKQHITVLSYQDVLQNTGDQQEVLASIRKMFECAESSGIHRFSAGEFLFIPDEQTSWPEIARCNKTLRDLAVEFCVQPLMLNKPLMKKQAGFDIKVIEGRFWQEFLSGVSLGTNLTMEGLKKIASVIIKHTTIGLHNREVLLPKNGPVLLTPTPIGLTLEYKSSPVMTSHLEARGMFCDKTTRSLSRGRAPSRGRGRGIKRLSTRGSSRGKPRRSSSDSSAGPNSSLADNLSDLVFLTNRRSLTDAELEAQDLLPSEQVNRINKVLKAYKNKCSLLKEAVERCSFLEDKLAAKDAEFQEVKERNKDLEKKERRYNETIRDLEDSVDNWESAYNRSEATERKYRRWYEEEKQENEQILEELAQAKDKYRKLKDGKKNRKGRKEKPKKTTRN